MNCKFIFCFVFHITSIRDFIKNIENAQISQFSHLNNFHHLHQLLLHCGQYSIFPSLVIQTFCCSYHMHKQSYHIPWLFSSLALFSGPPWTVSVIESRQEMVSSVLTHSWYLCIYIPYLQTGAKLHLFHLQRFIYRYDLFVNSRSCNTRSNSLNGIVSTSVTWQSSNHWLSRGISRQNLSF